MFERECRDACFRFLLPVLVAPFSLLAKIVGNLGGVPRSRDARTPWESIALEITAFDSIPSFWPSLIYYRSG